MNATEYAEFVDGYLTAALWSSTDEDGAPMDRAFSAEQCENVESAHEDCGSFLTETLAVERVNEAGYVPGPMERYIDEIGATFDATPWEQAGHDFWLTREGHGTGYWDRAPMDPQTHRANLFAKACEALSDAARAYGEATPYTTDDGGWAFSG